LFLTASLAEAQLDRPGQQPIQPRSVPQSDASGRLSVVAPVPERTPVSNIPNVTDSEIKSALASGIELTHPRNHVLLVGVNEYAEAGASTDRLVQAQFSKLSYCVNDMQALKSALVQARFCRDENIRMLVSGAGGENEPTMENVEVAFKELLGNIETGDRVLIAFSGHGISLLMERQPVDFLCCADAAVTYNSNTTDTHHRGIIRRTWLEESLDQSKASVKLLFIDACRNVLDDMTGILKSEESGTESDATIKAIGMRGVNRFGHGAPSDIKNGIFRFSSCAPEEVSWEIGSKKHGVFTHFLIEGMLGKAARENSQRIMLADLVMYVTEQTENYVKDVLQQRQSPRFARLPTESRQNEAGIVFSYVYEKPKEENNLVVQTTDNDGNGSEGDTSPPNPGLTLDTPPVVHNGPERVAENAANISRLEGLLSGYTHTFGPRITALRNTNQGLQRTYSGEGNDNLRQQMTTLETEIGTFVAAEKKRLEELNDLRGRYNFSNTNSNLQNLTSIDPLRSDWGRIRQEIARFNRQQPQATWTQQQINDWNTAGQALQGKIDGWNTRYEAQRQQPQPQTQPRRGEGRQPVVPNPIRPGRDPSVR